MDRNKEIELRPVAYDAHAQKDLATVPDFANDRAFFGEAIASGRALLVGVFAASERVATLIMTIDACEAALVVNYLGAAGRTPAKLLPKLDAWAREVARLNGCHIVRFWTSRRGLVRWGANMGYTQKFVLESEC